MKLKWMRKPINPAEHNLIRSSIRMKLVAGVGTLCLQPAATNKKIAVSSFPDPINSAKVKVYPCDNFNVELILLGFCVSEDQMTDALGV